MWSRLRSLTAGLLRRQRFEQEMTDELAFHVRSRTDDWVRKGMAPEEALRRARLEFGGVPRIEEDCRQARGLRLADEARLDVRYACRSLSRAPAFTAVVLLLLALGIGANTAMFSLVDAVLWRMLPVRDPGQLVFLERFPGRVAGGIKKFSDISYGLMGALRDRDPLVDDATTFNTAQLAASIDGALEPVHVLRVADNFYTMLGVGAAAGRLIQPGDGTGANVAILGNGYWQRRFGGRPVVGSSITIAGAPYTIVGVAHPAFHGLSPGTQFDVSTPMPTRELNQGQGPILDLRTRSLSVVLARLRQGADANGAATSLSTLLRQMLIDERAAVDPTQMAAHRIEAKPASHGIATLRMRVSKPLAALMALVLLVLLTTCANIANLQLARGAVRQREMAVRLSIGAGRGRLVRQLLTESLLLAAVGGLFGVAVAYGCIRGLLALLASAGEPIVLPVAIDGRTLLFTASTSMACGVLFGLAPAWKASRHDVESLVTRGASHGRPRSMPSRVLVVAQVTLSMVLLAGAGLFVRTFQNLALLDAGFDRTNVLAIAVDPLMARLEGPRIANLYQRAIERIAVLPGVRAVSFERNRPLSGGASLSSLRPPGFQAPNDLITWFEEVGPRYAETLGLRVITGRDLQESDVVGAPRVLLINETAAATFFPGQNPLGRRMGRGNADDLEVVGVVADVRHQNLREPPRLTVYVPALQDPNIRSTSLLIRTTGDPLALTSAVREIVRAIEPSVPIMNVTTLEQVAARSLIAERLTATLGSVFGLLALLLAGVGLSGVLLFGVTRRTRELGVRMALGATVGRIAGMVLRESAFVVCAGIVVGLPCAWAVGRLVQSLLFGLSPADPVTLGGAVVALAATSVIASLWPARRAATVNPIVALRAE